MKKKYDFLNRHPLLKAAGAYCLKRVWERVELAIASLVVAGFLTLWQHHAVHNQIWLETGDHFGDLVHQVQMLEIQANGHIETNNIGK